MVSISSSGPETHGEKMLLCYFVDTEYVMPYMYAQCCLNAFVMLIFTVGPLAFDDMYVAVSNKNAIKAVKGEGVHFWDSDGK